MQKIYVTRLISATFYVGAGVDKDSAPPALRHGLETCEADF